MPKITIKKTEHNLEVARLNTLATKIKQLKAAGSELRKYVVHDSCEAEHNDGSTDDDECDCGLKEALETFDALVSR